jgi:hypothetical protein
MTDLRRVSGPSSRADRHVGQIIAVVVIAIVIAVLKPWGTNLRSGPISTAIASPTALPSAAPLASSAPRAYDFLTFGTNEPPPAWELWPAGSLASFSFAMRIDMTTPTSDEPSEAPTASPIAIGSAGGPSIPPSWPTIRIPLGSSLELIGLNRPLGYTLDVTGLARIDDDGSETPIAFVLGRPPWPTHFMAVGYAASDGAGMDPWPPGHYRLDVVIDPGGVARSIEIIIEGPPPAPSASPSVAASLAP